MSANTGSSQSKKLPGALLSNLALRFRLFKRKYSTPSSYKKLFVTIVMYLLVFGLAFVFIYPFLYMIVTSLMSNSDLNSSSVHWLPTELKFENYSIAYQLLKGKMYAINSAKVTILATAGHVIACSFIGYGFARYNFPLKKLLFALVILAFIVPTQTIIIPSYLSYANIKWWNEAKFLESGFYAAVPRIAGVVNKVMNSLFGNGWLNTYYPFIIPSFFGFGLKGALYIFLFRQFYLTVPKSLEEAARIDGCGFMKTYWKIVFPLAKATLVVAIVLSIVWHWNDAYEPGIYIDSPSKQFLPPRIRVLVEAANAAPENQTEMMRNLGLEDGEDVLNDAVIMAGAAIISAPVLVFFAFAQSQFMQGIERSGITGE